jgi:hypothetical protein
MDQYEFTELAITQAKSQKPKAKSQKPKAKSQKPKAKSQKPDIVLFACFICQALNGRERRAQGWCSL